MGLSYNRETAVKYPINYSRSSNIHIFDKSNEIETGENISQTNNVDAENYITLQNIETKTNVSGDQYIDITIPANFLIKNIVCKIFQQTNDLEWNDPRLVKGDHTTVLDTFLRFIEGQEAEFNKMNDSITQESLTVSFGITQSGGASDTIEMGLFVYGYQL